MKYSKTYFNTIIYFIVSMFGLIPFYIMFVMGTYYSEDLFRKIVIIPGNYYFQNFKTVIASNFLLYYWNSFYVSVLSTFLSVFISCLAGFAFSKYSFKFRKHLFYFVLMTMMIPTQLGLVAYVIQIRYMGLHNTHIPLIANWAANAFGVFWMTQYIHDSVPMEVIESSRLDGCSEPRIFLSIIIPYIKPAIITLSMLVFLWSWNYYLLPMIIINKPRLFTLPLGIATIGSQYRTDYGARIMGMSLGTIPILMIFTIGSKYFIQGLTAGAVKG